MTLHILSSIAANKVKACKQALQPEDSILLIGDAVHLANQFLDLPNILVRQTDVGLRGINPPTSVRSISDDEWVTLTLNHQPVISWHD